MDINTIMLTRLNIRSYSARRHDRKVSKDVAEQHKTDEAKAGRYNKILIDPKAPTFLAVNRAAQAARDYHYEHTLPWTNEGVRMLPRINYFDYCAGLSEKESKFREAVDAFIKDWPNLKEEARVRLNGLYREDDYPTLSALRHRFGFSIDFEQVPDPSDFRVSLGEAEEEAIRQSIADRVQTGIAEAHRDLWGRLHEVVTKMVERLTIPDGRFCDTLVTNVRDLVELLPRLNFTEDPELERLRQEVAAKLAKHEPRTLREQPDIRAKTAAEAAEIARKMAAFMGPAK